MKNFKLSLALVALTMFSSSVFAEQIQLIFEGVVNNDPNEPFTLVIEYSSDATDLISDQDCCGKYVPMSLEITHHDEVLSIPNAGLNVDAIISENFEGIQWVDDGEPWSGTLMGQSVVTGSINFGRAFTGQLSKDLPLSVNLNDWEYHNGCFELFNGEQACVDLKVQLSSNDVSTKKCPTGTIGYWPMESNGTEIINNLEGSLVGNVAFSAGQVGSAAYFDGDTGSYIDAGMSALLSRAGAESMSVSAWVYREADGSAGAAFVGTVIAARTWCNSGNWQLYSNLGPSFYYSKWQSPGVEDQLFSETAIPLQDWTHIAVTYAADEVRFYINGNLDRSISPLNFGGPFQGETQNIQLGWDSCDSYFNGGLDEVAVFETTLTQSEVSDLYLAGFRGDTICKIKKTKGTKRKKRTKRRNGSNRDQ